MESLPDEMLLKIFQFAVGKDIDGLGLKTLLALKYTCIKFYNFVEDFQSALVIPSVDLCEKDLIIEKTSIMNSLKQTLRVGGPEYEINDPLLTMLEKHGISQIRLTKGTIDIKDTAYSVPSILSRKRKGLVICIRSGWIVDGLSIHWPIQAEKTKSVFGGGPGGSLKIWVLDQDEKIVRLFGEQCYFDNTRVVGKLTILTTKRQIGPVGYSGDPNANNDYLVFDYFDLDLANKSPELLIMEFDPFKRRHLGEISLAGFESSSRRAQRTVRL